MRRIFLAPCLCGLNVSGGTCGSKSRTGITARPVEMMSPDLRVLGAADGLPPLPDTEYLLCRDPSGQNELAQVIYQAMDSAKPWQYSQFTPEGGDDSLMVEGDFE